MGAMDELIDEAVVGELSRLLGNAGFRPDALVVAAGYVDGRKLRQRVDVVRDALLVDLPDSYAGSARLVRDAFADEELRGWMLWPVSEAVVDRALATDRVREFDDAMAVLALLTTRFTGEFAIRAMLAARLERAIGIAETWTSHPDEHVRRLASEGTRSHLPWAKGVPALVGRPYTRAIVDRLYRDASEYVRRSAANHVNDLSRDHPDVAAEIAAGWLSAPDDNTQRVSRHALRTLVKKGHPRALEVMGFTGAEFVVDGPTVDESVVALGDSVRFTGRVTNGGTEPVRAAIDFVLHFQKSNGETRPKVFKIGVSSLQAGESIDIAKSFAMQPRTTRVLHLGEHALELQVNGVAYGRAVFDLV